jgi:drug/metabolite transporter (DMT)-like permease
MLIGASIVFLPDVLAHASVNKGDLLIVLGVTFAPFINYYQRRAREKTNSETVLIIRTAIGIPLMLVFAYVMGESTTVPAVLSVLPFIIASGILAFGFSKILWLEGINRIPITKAVALASFFPIATLFFAFLILGQSPTAFQVFSFIPLFIGVLLLTRKAKE